MRSPVAHAEIINIDIIEAQKLPGVKVIITGDETDEPFLGRSAGTSKQGISDDTAHEIDNEVKEILSDCYEIAKDILTKNLDALHSMSKALMDYETLDVDQIDDIMAGGCLLYTSPSPRDRQKSRMPSSA